MKAIGKVRWKVRKIEVRWNIWSIGLDCNPWLGHKTVRVYVGPICLLFVSTEGWFEPAQT